MRLLLFAALVGFLAHDWSVGGLRSARPRVKLVYALLLAAAGYHMLIVMGTINAPSYYDLFVRIYGGGAKGIIAHLKP